MIKSIIVSMKYEKLVLLILSKIKIACWLTYIWNLMVNQWLTAEIFA